MFKRLLLILTIFAAVMSISYFFSPKNRSAPFAIDCPFCDPQIISRQKFYEDDLVMVLYTHKPIFQGHCLIIPKRHVTRFELLTDAEAAHITTIIKKVHRAASEIFGTTSYLILQKNGKEVGQSVPHLHFHYIPRMAGDSSSLKFIVKVYIANIKKPLPYHEMHEVIEKLKTHMQNFEQ